MFDRCPKAWLEQDARAEALLIGEASLFRERNILPRSGGWRDQDPKFVEALAIVDVELAKLKKWADETEAVRKAGGHGQ